MCTFKGGCRGGGVDGLGQPVEASETGAVSRDTYSIINRDSQETPLDGSIAALLFDLRILDNSGFLKPLSLSLRSMIY